jgi:hypothetical protein
MLQHLFYVMIGFDPNAKWFEILLKMHLENQIGKMKRNFYSFSFSFFLFGLLARFPPLGPLVLPHSLLGQPIWQKGSRCRESFPSAADIQAHS